MPTDKTTKKTPMSEQALRAAAREHAKIAPKPDPEIGKKALADAQASRKARLPAQKLSATPLKDAAGENRHHRKDQILSEFDGSSED
jgi:hypothetical protein